VCTVQIRGHEDIAFPRIHLPTFNPRGAVSESCLLWLTLCILQLCSHVPLGTVWLSGLAENAKSSDFKVLLQIHSTCVT
jgi:hypothetical protein